MIGRWTKVNISNKINKRYKSVNVEGAYCIKEEIIEKKVVNRSSE